MKDIDLPGCLENKKDSLWNSITQLNVTTQLLVRLYFFRFCISEKKIWGMIKIEYTEKKESKIDFIKKIIFTKLPGKHEVEMEIWNELKLNGNTVFMTLKSKIQILLATTDLQFIITKLLCTDIYYKVQPAKIRS